MYSTFYMSLNIYWNCVLGFIVIVSGPAILNPAHARQALHHWDVHPVLIFFSPCYEVDYKESLGACLYFYCLFSLLLQHHLVGTW